MLVASNNKSKIAEIKSLLPNYEIFSLKDKNINIDIIEDKTTFSENALKKAQEIYELTKEPVIADDSGLCIASLNDWPGVLTNRFLGYKATDIEKNNAILEKIAPYSNRNAKFICTIAYYDGKNTIIAEGVLKGKISLTRRGTNGFGFDEIFELSTGKTLAELSPLEKNKISARYQALINLKDQLKKLKS